MTKTPMSGNNLPMVGTGWDHRLKTPRRDPDPVQVAWQLHIESLGYPSVAAYVEAVGDLPARAEVARWHAACAPQHARCNLC